MTQTDTYALSRFLLARIAEDESNGTDLVGVARKDWRARWVAECNAKRLIVDLYDPHDYADDGGIGSSWVMKQALEALAVVYSDHPDYREKW